MKTSGFKARFDREEVGRREAREGRGVRLYTNFCMGWKIWVRRIHPLSCAYMWVGVRFHPFHQ